MAIWAVTPESMWLIRCASGCSASMSDAGHFRLDRVLEQLSRISSRDLPQSGFMVRMYSLAFGGSACSSSSARPVRRAKCRISPVRVRPAISASLRACAIDDRRDIWFDASSDEPGGSVTLTCTLPSSNVGRKSAPRRRQLPGAERDEHPGQQEQKPGPRHAEADQVRRDPLQAAEQEAVAVAVGRLRLRQQVVRQHRRHVSDTSSDARIDTM